MGWYIIQIIKKLKNLLISSNKDLMISNIKGQGLLKQEYCIGFIEIKCKNRGT